MTRDKELESLRRQLAVSKQKSKIVKARFDVESEKRKIKRELFLLKHSKALRIGGGAIKVGTRFGRGFKILAKGTGKAILKQGRLIKERQIQESKRKGKKKSFGVRDFDPLALDF